MTTGEVIFTLLVLYITMAFVKFMLMASSAHVAAGVHMRMARRMGHSPSFLRCYLALLTTIAPIAVIGWPGALKTEGWSFLRTYTRREVIRDVVLDYREMLGN